MSFFTNIRLLKPILRSVVVNAPRAYTRHQTLATQFNVQCAKFSSITYRQNHLQQIRSLGSDAKAFSKTTNHQGNDDDGPVSLAEVLDREIQEEMAEVNQRLSSDQFPGFSVETEDAEVKLTKQIGDSTVTVRFTVSSSLSEWQSERQEQQDQQQQQQSDQPDQMSSFTLLSLPEFQVQITRDGKTLEVSCYFEEMDQEEESGEQYPIDPVFNVDELVMYEGEPRETEFAVSAEYFRGDLQEGILQYLADHGIDDEFAKNLVSFSTNYEKKQYIGLMKRLKDFVSK